MLMLCLGSCIPLPKLASLAVHHLSNNKNTIDLVPTFLNTPPVARLCATAAGQEAASLYVWPHLRNNL